MLQRQNKNNDLLIQVEGAGISKIEYYTDGLYKYTVEYSPTVYIPSSELQKMNDGQLRSTVYLATDNENYPDGTQDRVINQTFNIWIGTDTSTQNYYTKDEIDSMGYLTEIPEEYITEDELNDITYKFYTKAEVDSKIPKDYIKEIPSEYVTESELNQKGYLTEHQSLSNYYTKSEVDNKISASGNFDPDQYYTKTEIDNKGYLTEVPDTYALKSDIPDTTNFATKSEIPDTSTLATKQQVESITDNVYTKTEIDSKFGDIDTILDNINGEVV